MSSEIVRLGEEARLALGEGRVDDARGLLRPSVSLCAESGVHSEAVGALRMLAQIEHGLGRGDEESALYHEAVVLCREAGHPTLLAHTIRHLGDLLRHSSDLEGADACYSEAIELYRASSETHPSELANAVRPMAILQEALGNSEAARTLWAEAQEDPGGGCGVCRCPQTSRNRLGSRGF